MAQVLFINVENQTVGNLTATTNNDIINQIGNGATSLDMFQLPNGDYLVYDMSAFFRTPVGGFVHTDMNWLLKSNGCVIGYDPINGVVQDCVSTAIDVLNAVTFKDADECSNA